MQRKHLWESGCRKSCWALKHLSLSVYGNTHTGFDRACWNNVSREFQRCIYDDALLRGKTKTFNSLWCVCTFINISKCFFCMIYQPECLLACMMNSILQTCADCSHLAVQTFGCKAQTTERLSYSLVNPGVSVKWYCVVKSKGIQTKLCQLKSTSS